MTLPDTLYCPDISVNLISASKLCDIGATFTGTAERMSFVNAKTNEQLHATRKPHSNQLWTVQPPNQSTCLSISTDVLHQRLGHLHSRALQRFCNRSGKSDLMCTLCILAKSHRHPFKSQLPKADRLLYRVHSDIVGPIETNTPSRTRYFVTFVDEHSRYCKVYLMTNKSEAFKKFKEFLIEAERQTGQKLCVLKSDRGGEYRSTQSLAFAAANRITLKQGPPHTPEHNSVAERYNRTIMERTRAQMIHAGAPKTLWGEFTLATCHILNLSPGSATDNLPINLWTIPNAGPGAHHGDISFLRVLGCQAYTHIPKSQR